MGTTQLRDCVSVQFTSFPPSFPSFLPLLSSSFYQEKAAEGAVDLLHFIAVWEIWVQVQQDVIASLEIHYFLHDLLIIGSQALTSRAFPVGSTGCGSTRYTITNLSPA